MPRMRFWSSRAIGIIGVLAVCGCSAGPSKEPEQPRTDVTPIPTVKANAPPPRPSPCEVAGLLVARAEALRGEGLLERAKRALGDAEARCPSKAKEIGEARAKVEAARAVGPGTRVSLPDPSVPVAFAWSPDGTRAALLHGGELSVYDPDLRTETERYSVPRETTALRWLPAGNGVVVGDLSKRRFQIVDLAKKRAEAAFQLSGEEATDMRFSPDGKTLVLSWEMGISFVDLATKKVTELALSPLTISDISISPSGNRLAVGLSDGTVRVYGIPGLARMPEIPFMAASLRPYFQTDERLVLAADSGTVVTYDVTTGKQVGKKLVNDECSPLIAGEKNDRVVWSCYAMLSAESTSGSKKIDLYTPTTEAHLYTSFNAMSVSANGAWIWYSLWGQQYIVDTKTGKLVAGVSVPSWGGVQFRPDGRRIAAIRTEGTTLWTSDLKKDERDVNGGGQSFACSKVGVGGSGELVFLDVEAGEDWLPGPAKLTLRGLGEAGETTAEMRIEACPESLSAGARVGIALADQIDVLSLPKGTRLAELPLSPDRGEAAVLTADGTAVVVWGDNGVRTIDVATKKILNEWSTRLHAKREVFASPSGKRVLVVQDQHGSLYEAGRGAALELALGPGPFAFAGDDLLVEAREAEIVVHDLAAHEDRAVPGPKSVKRLAATPDGARVIAVLPGETDVIDAARTSGGVVAKLGGISAEEQIVFFAGGRVLGVGAREGSVRLYQLPSGTRLGELQRFGATAAVYRAETGNLETFGDVTSVVRCARDPQVLPFSDCSEGFVETGLLARTVAGRGCTAEDVGDVCD